MSQQHKKVRKAVFPVAGLGTRFLPATKAVPKEMLTVVDRPVIQHVVDEARAAGIEHFIFVTGRNKAVIEDHFDLAYELEDMLEKRGKQEALEGLEREEAGGQRVVEAVDLVPEVHVQRLGGHGADHAADGADRGRGHA